jgi:hypothetical protein
MFKHGNSSCACSHTCIHFLSPVEMAVPAASHRLLGVVDALERIHPFIGSCSLYTFAKNADDARQ